MATQGRRTDWGTFASVMIAVIGGIVTAWVAVYTAQSDRAKTLELEKLRLQSSILLQAINTNHDRGRALANLRFFHERKLLEFTEDQLKNLEDKPDTIPSTTSPTREADRPAQGIAATAGARVFVQFAGSLQRDRVREMMRDLAGEWRVEGIELGGQRTTLAAGVNEVRYGASGDKAAAERLAEARIVRKLHPRYFIVDSGRASAALDRRGVVRLARTGTARRHRVPAGREPRTEGAAERPANAVQ